MQKSIQEARSIFPRLNFVGDAELQSQLAAPLKEALKAVAQKVFHVVGFEHSDSGDIVGFFGAGSDEGQSFKFAEAVKAEDFASTLVKLQAAIKAKVKADMHTQLADKEWHVHFKTAGVAEAVVIADEVYYCRMVEEAISKGGLYDALDAISDKIQKLIEAAKSQMERTQRMVHNSRVNIAVVWKRVIARLIKGHCMRTCELIWKSYSRFYFDGSAVTVKIGEHSMAHGYEYQGTVQLLTVTQLTEQLNFSFGETLRTNKAQASLGPAGSGKTETVKDFGQKLGRWVSVTQMSDQFTRQELVKIIQGLTAESTWVVFDEFNRVHLETIKEFMGDFDEFLAARADKENGFFVTMNPGYAGKSKVEFSSNWNTNSMDKPDFLDIIQLMLSIHGFHSYEELGYRFEKVRYEWRWQMPPTDHYDFGLRMVKMVIDAAGGNIRNNLAEDDAMLAAIMQVVFPGTVDAHHETFKAILGKNGFKIAEYVFPKNEKAVHDSYDAEKFQQKCAMFAGMAQVRHAIQVMGHNHGYVEAIAKANDYHLVTVDVANAEPAGFAMCKEWHKNALDESKAKGTANQWLYGYTEDGAWKEGEFTKALREVISGETSKKDGIKLLHLKMYMFDCSVLEDLNSLMDDNKQLKVNGEVFHLPSDVRVVLESDTCMVQSPATVSRCGFVFFTYEETRQKK